MTKRPPSLIDARPLKALTHPTRIQIMDILSEGTNSPTGIQRRIGDISLNLVGHHIKVLRELGFVNLVEEVQRGGFTEHIYGASQRLFLTAEEWDAVDPDDRQSATTTILRVISEDVGKAYIEGKFDERTDNHLSRSPLELDGEGWEEVVRTLEETLHSVLQAEKKSRERIRRSGAQPIAARVVIMQFPTSRETPKM